MAAASAPPQGLDYVDLCPDLHQRRWLRLIAPDGDGPSTPLTVCELCIDPLQLLLPGSDDTQLLATRVDGIGNVFTHEQWRRRGLAGWLIDRAIEIMCAGDAEWSLLYGIDHYYERWGWESCGDERWAEISAIDAPGSETGRWAVRGASSNDHDAIQLVYEASARTTPGAMVRDFGAARAWTFLGGGKVIVAERDGEVEGYAWISGAGPECDAVSERNSSLYVTAEIHATGSFAATALVRDLLVRSDGVSLLIGAPDGHVVRSLGASITGRLIDELRPHGGAMMLDVSGRQLMPLHNLYQFVPDRF